MIGHRLKIETLTVTRTRRSLVSNVDGRPSLDEDAVGASVDADDDEPVV